MSGTRRRWTIAFLVVLAALAVAVIATGGDDDVDTAGPAATTTSTPLPAGPVADEALAVALLPPVSALGSDWVETQRDDTATAAEPSTVEGCPNGPVPEGFLIHSEQQRVQHSAVIETLSVTAGIVSEGTDPFDLDDESVVACLRDGLQAQVPETSTVTVGAEVALGPPPAGAIVTHLRLEVATADGTLGRFDFLLVRRDRLVSLGLVTGFDPEVATELAAVVVVLDRPLSAAVDRLD